MVRKAARMQRNSCTEGQGTAAAGMRSLIVNADDLGWTQGVNRGIAEAHRNGIVTSTSLLANGAAFEDGVETAQRIAEAGRGSAPEFERRQPGGGSE